MIVLPEPVLEAIRDHGREAYPEECCGALFGARGDSGARVKLAERVRNASSRMRQRRFRIAPRDYLRLERQADALGLDLLGFYHSHPDHPARMSDYDREHGLPFLHYLVLSVATGRPGEVTSWIMEEDRGVFEQEELRIQGPGE